MRVLPLFLLCAVLLCACAVEEEARLGYRERAFSCRLEGVLDGVAFDATLSVGAPVDGRTRDFTLCFSSPNGLAGIVLERREGHLLATCDGLSLEGERFVGWVQIAELFCLEGEICEMGVTTLKGREVNFVSMACESGRVRVLLEAEQSHPCRMEGELRGHSLSVAVVQYQETDET